MIWSLLIADVDFPKSTSDFSKKMTQSAFLIAVCMPWILMFLHILIIKSRPGMTDGVRVTTNLVSQIKRLIWVRGDGSGRYRFFILSSPIRTWILLCSVLNSIANARMICLIWFAPSLNSMQGGDPKGGLMKHSLKAKMRWVSKRLLEIMHSSGVFKRTLEDRCHDTRGAMSCISLSVAWWLHCGVRNSCEFKKMIQQWLKLKCESGPF